MFILDKQKDIGENWIYEFQQIKSNIVKLQTNKIMNPQNISLQISKSMNGIAIIP